MTTIHRLNLVVDREHVHARIVARTINALRRLITSDTPHPRESADLASINGGRLAVPDPAEDLVTRLDHLLQIDQIRRSVAGAISDDQWSELVFRHGYGVSIRDLPNRAGHTPGTHRSCLNRQLARIRRATEAA